MLRIDKLIMNLNKTGQKNFNETAPAPGLHHIRNEDAHYFMYREEKRYIIYTYYHSSIQALRKRLEFVDPDKMCVFRIEFNYAVEEPFVEAIINKPTFGNSLRPFQQQIVDRIRSRMTPLSVSGDDQSIECGRAPQYPEDLDFNEVFLVCGPTECGKSAIGKLLKMEIPNSILLEKVNLTKRDLLSEKHIFSIRPQESQFLIVTINEIDKALEYAYNSQLNVEFSTIVQSKGTINDFLDSLREKTRLIVIMTSNVPIKELRQRYPEATNGSRITGYFEHV